ncbi:polyphosphate polymerase domain-containing protein [Streptococcus entericus]
MTKRIHQKEFKRVETKYLVSLAQLPHLLSDLGEYMEADDFAQSTITSLYFDTEHFDMVQDSLAKKYGKEKLRLRTYDRNGDLEAPAFLEIKQKIDGVGYKYRIKTSPKQAGLLAAGDMENHTEDKRLLAQLETLQQRYGTIKPRMLISYKRLSFKGKDNPSIRVTLDTSITYALVNDLVLTSSMALPLLPEQQLIMEIKVSDQLPAWLENILNQYNLDKVSFSKYGQAYTLYQSKMLEREAHYA